MNNIIGIAIVAAIVFLIYKSVNSQPPPTIDGKVLIKYEDTQLHWKHKEGSDGVGTLFISDKTSGKLIASYVADGSNLLYEDPTQSASIAARYRPDAYSSQWNCDIGAFAGFCKDSPEIGLRISPIRFLFDTTAPDAIISNDRIGVGLSVFCPPRILPEPFGHIGIGTWYSYPFDDKRHDPGFIFGLSLQTKY
jgi:hypothetical protein